MTNYGHQPDILLQQECNLGNMAAAADELSCDPAKLQQSNNVEKYMNN